MDDAAAGVGSVLFPLAGHAALATRRTDFETELSRLKGQYEAMRQAAAVNDCISALGNPRNTAERLARSGLPVTAGKSVPLDLPEGPKPFEGTPASTLLPQQVQAYCGVPWERRVDPETGRTLYNPCLAPEAFE
jgi:hypothetical protein